MFGCSQRVRVLLFEMLSKCMFREPKSAEEGKDYLNRQTTLINTQCVEAFCKALSQL